MADDADEVKVFESQEADDLDQQSTDQLDVDKKDVVFEAELESRPEDIGTKPGAFSKISPSIPGMGIPMMGSPNFAAFCQLPFPMMMPLMQPMSPSFMSPYAAAAYAAAALSPRFMPLQPLSPAFQTLQKFNGVSLPPQMRMGPGPLNQLNNMAMPFNNPITSIANSMSEEGHRRHREGKKKDDHVKKPLNAFMWFMKINRPKISAELGFKEKQSAELNKELGRRWHELKKEEQQKYFDMAKKDREDHKTKYPTWSARENYAIRKTKKRRRDKTEDSVETKKCRARYGTNNQERWCKPCRRKKKCEFAKNASYPPSDGRMSADMSGPGSSGPSPMTSSMSGPSPLGHSSPNDSDNDSDMEADVDDRDDEDERTLTHQALQEMDTAAGLY